MLVNIVLFMILYYVLWTVIILFANNINFVIVIFIHTAAWKIYFHTKNKMKERLAA